MKQSGFLWEITCNLKVKGIDTCKLVMRSGRTLFLHDVLFAPQICQNLIYVLELLKLGFSWYFQDTWVNLSLGTIYFGSGYVLDRFFIMDLDYNLSICNVSFSMFSTLCDSKNDVNV